MHIDILLVDGVYILFVVLGALFLSVLQCGITTSHVFRLTRKVGPDYWGYGTPGEKPSEPTISVHPPAREMQSAYGKRS